MKSKIVYIFWGIVFLLAGVGFLSGMIDVKQLSQQTKIITLITASAAFIVTYFVDGIKKWGWLLPAFLCAALAVGIGVEPGRMKEADFQMVLILASLALWFYTGYALNRKHWGLLIPAYILTLATTNITVSSLVVGAALRGDALSTSLLVLASSAGLMLMLAIPFYIVYFRTNKDWWALIPAGCLTSIGLVMTLQVLVGDKQNSMVGIFTGVLLLGLAATFGFLWFRRKTQPTDWAKYPAVGLFGLAILAFILGNAWNTLSDQTKAIAFAVASAAFFICYLVNGLRKWGWLFPAMFCAGMALTLWMSINNMDDSPLSGLPILAGIALPFYVGFAIEPKHRWLLIPAFILTMIMIISLNTDSDYEGMVVMFTFAAPFFITYFWSEKNWWAFIPAGFFATIGLVNLLQMLIPHEDYANLSNTMSWGYYTWVMFFGFAITFGIPWLMRRNQSTNWAKYPAIGFMALAILALILGERFQEFWLASIMFVISGLFLLAILYKKSPSLSQGSSESKA